MRTSPAFHPETDGAEWALWAQRRFEIQVDALLTEAFDHPETLRQWVGYLIAPTAGMGDDTLQEQHHLFLLNAATHIRKWQKQAAERAVASAAPVAAEDVINATPMALLAHTVVIDRLTALLAHRPTIEGLDPVGRQELIWSVLAAPVGPHAGGEFGRFNQVLRNAKGILEGSESRLARVTSLEEGAGVVQERLEKDKAPVKGLPILLARAEMEHRLAVRRAQMAVREATKRAMHDLVIQRRRERLGLDPLPPLPGAVEESVSARRMTH